MGDEVWLDTSLPILIFMYTDFSLTLIHCSQLSRLMSDGKEKTNMQMWEEATLLLEEEQLKYRAIKKKDGKAAIKKLDKIKKLMLRLGELDEIKDKDVLSEAAKTFLTRVYGWEKWHKWTFSPTDAENYWYTQKGNDVEDKSIEMVAYLDDKPYKKNKIRYEDDILTGMPDIIDGNYIIDVKSSWDWETFVANISKPLTKAYWWQMQGYFSLTGAIRGEVSFCLNSTPEDVIIKEIEKKGLQSRYPSMEWILNKYSYDDIPEDERRIRFIIERNEEAIKKIPAKVQLAREYLFLLQEMHKETRLANYDL